MQSPGAIAAGGTLSCRLGIYPKNKQMTGQASEGEIIQLLGG
jgi:hypothetical protein